MKTVSSEHGLGTEAEGGSRVRHMGLLGFVSVAFFWVIGGMYGMETVVTLAPPLYVITALLVCPIFFAIPATFLCVDLASAFPFDGPYLP